MDAGKIGYSIKFLRKRRGLTQETLAQALNVTDKAVSKWERGISVPDITLITQLSMILDVDLDNLLEGNVTFLEKAWCGVFIGPEKNGKVNAGTQVYGKPAVYFILCYFMLAGVHNITFYLNDRDAAFVKEHFGDGRGFGLKLSYCPVGASIRIVGNTMVMEGYFFLYGSNLTKYFQRAMSHAGKRMVLVLSKPECSCLIPCSFDNQKRLRKGNGQVTQYYQLPVLFLAGELTEKLEKPDYVQSALHGKEAYAEPMGRGMVECLLRTDDDVNDISNFIRIVQKLTGYNLYDITEVAKNRRFIE